MKASTAIRLAQKRSQQGRTRRACSFYLPHEIADWIEEYANEKELTKSAIAEALLMEGITAIKRGEEKRKAAKR